MKNLIFILSALLITNFTNSQTVALRLTDEGNLQNYGSYWGKGEIKLIPSSGNSYASGTVTLKTVAYPLLSNQPYPEVGMELYSQDGNGEQLSLRLQPNGNALFNKNLTINGNALLNGDLSTNGNALFNEDLSVNGNALFNEDLSINGSISGSGLYNSLHIVTYNNGYVNIGPMYSNNAHCHFKSNSTYGYHFDNGLEVVGGSFSSFTGPLYLKTQRYTHITINSNGYTEIDPSSRVSNLGSDDVVLYVDGCIEATGSVIESDSIIKKDISSLNDSTIKLLYSINSKKYKLKNKEELGIVNTSNKISLLDETEISNDDTTTVELSKQDKTEKVKPYHYGFIAQEVQKVYPELVILNRDSLLAINYDGFIPLLVEALKNQQAMIESMQEIINTHEKAIAQLTKSTAIKKSASDEETFPEQEEEDVAILFQNTPNPFNETTRINYYIPETVDNAQIVIFNMVGSELDSYPIYTKGNYFLEISANTLFPGMYHYALITDNTLVETKTMIINE